MARCRCQSENCTCAVRPGAGVGITGSGSPNDPWVISSPPASSGTLRVQDTQTVDLVLSGTGTQSDPYTLRANVIGVPGLFDAIGTYGQLAAVAAGGAP